MLPTRSLARTARASRTLRPSKLPRTQRRFQSTTSSTSQTSTASSASSSHIAAGLAGGLASATVLYILYRMSPSGQIATKINKTAKEAEKKYQQAASTLQTKAPSTDEAVQRVKEFCYSYVAFIPGGRQYVDTAFKDFESVREKNRDEVDKIVQETYKQVQDVAKTGLSMESVTRVWEILTELGGKIGQLAGSAVDQILENHPQLRDKVGGPMEQLRQMGEQYGPEAKKMVDETWEQVREVLKGGWSMESVERVRGLVEEKTGKMREMADQAWQRGLEQAKPYLERNPKVKELIEENKDLLKEGNATALFAQVKKAVEKGDVGSLEEYVKNAVEKAKQAAPKSMGALASGGSNMAGLGQLMGVSSKEASQQVQQNIAVLSEVMKNHSKEGKQLLEETRDDLEKVLEEKAKKAREIVDSAKQEAK